MDAARIEIDTRISQLKREHATRSQWNQAAGKIIVLATLADLREALPIDDPTSETERDHQRELLGTLFRSSHVTVLYGFECDTRVIVFFDAQGQQKYACP